MKNWLKHNWFWLVATLVLVFGLVGFMQLVDNSRYTFEVLPGGTMVRCDKIENQCSNTSVDLNQYD